MSCPLHHVDRICWAPAPRHDVQPRDGSIPPVAASSTGSADPRDRQYRVALDGLAAHDLEVVHTFLGAKLSTAASPTVPTSIRRRISMRQPDSLIVDRADPKVAHQDRLMIGDPLHAAPDLLFEQDWRQRAAEQPDAVTHVAVEDDRTAVDHADRKPVTQLTVGVVGDPDVEYQRLARNRCLAAHGNPLVVAALFHDHIGKDLQRAIRRLVQLESFVASAIRHAAHRSNGRAAVA